MGSLRGRDRPWVGGVAKLGLVLLFQGFTGTALAQTVPPETRDPGTRALPPPHRFRLGVEFFYVRLVRAVAPDGERQRFHLAPGGLDFAYQAQFLRRVMVRPALAISVNAANSFFAMPVFIHPKVHFGYQGALLGAAVGYGYFTPVWHQENVADPIRGGLGAPVLLHSHHVDAEFSLTSRVDRGALSLLVRVSATNGKIVHYDNEERSWRPMVTMNVGWYFGDGHRQRRRRERR